MSLCAAQPDTSTWMEAIPGERMGREKKLPSHAGHDLQGQGEAIPGIAFLSSNHEGSKAQLVGHVHLYMA